MFERIQFDPKIHFGKPFVRGTRITVENVLELINEGVAFEDITRDYYPDLSKEDVTACMDYAIALVSAEHIDIAA